ncbi:MAG: stage III sporulation protein AF [Clostridia bacterium]|nr:stage III sporulation protein AF [Clostridia bacterium]
MIKFISSWAQGIVIAVIIGTIIEMILPEGNNKKYIKTIIGVYILFTIVVPVINKFTKEPFELDTSKYDRVLGTTYEQESVEEKVNLNIQNTYKQNLKEDIREKVEGKNYDVIKI